MGSITNSYLNLFSSAQAETTRKATLSQVGSWTTSLARDLGRLCAVGDPVHARKHLAREPGGPENARNGRSGPRREG